MANRQKTIISKKIRRMTLQMSKMTRKLKTLTKPASKFLYQRNSSHSRHQTQINMLLDKTWARVKSPIRKTSKFQQGSKLLITTTKPHPKISLLSKKLLETKKRLKSPLAVNAAVTFSELTELTNLN